jgi:hypothetical protein
MVPSLSRSAIVTLALDRACIVAVSPEQSTGRRLDDIRSPLAETSRFLLHNALMRKCNNAQRIDCERLLSRKQRAYYGRTRVLGLGHMNDDFRRRRVANAGGKRAASVPACGRVAQALLARRQRNERAAPQALVSLTASINREQQSVEHDCGFSMRGRLVDRSRSLRSANMAPPPGR